MNKNTTGCIFVVYWRRKMLCSFCERSFRVRDNPFDNKTSWVTTKRVHSDSEIKHSMETRIIRFKSKFIHFWNVRKRMTALCCRVIPQNGKIKFASSSNEMLIMSKLYSLLVLLFLPHSMSSTDAEAKHLNKFESPLLFDFFCQVRLKITKRFRKRTFLKL